MAAGVNCASLCYIVDNAGHPDLESFVTQPDYIAED